MRLCAFMWDFAVALGLWLNVNRAAEGLIMYPFSLHTFSRMLLFRLIALILLLSC